MRTEGMPPSRQSMNTVSEKLFSIAMSCIPRSEIPVMSVTTPRWLPPLSPG